MLDYVKQVLTGKQWIKNLKMNFKNQTPIESIDEIEFYWILYFYLVHFDHHNSTLYWGFQENVVETYIVTCISQLISTLSVAPFTYIVPVQNHHISSDIKNKIKCKLMKKKKGFERQKV